MNAAQRLEQTCEPGRNISASTLHHVGALFVTEPRGQVEIKHKGAIDMYFLARIKPEFATDPDGNIPNAAFWKSAGLASPASRRQSEVPS